ncbi:MAG: RHS repeat-associated core domain-containing protein [Halioglobus sp.]
MNRSKYAAGLVTGGIWLTAAGSAFALTGEETIFYHNDALGSPIIATGEEGSVLWREAYSPYGSRLLNESREKDCNAGSCVPLESIWDEKQWYTGKLEETRTGIQYFGARWYEPELGRFLSVDPVQFRDENPFSFNRYAYANGNPYKYVDPDGREVVKVGVSIRLPKLLGLAQKVLGREISVSGFEAGLAFSSPNALGKGEYDLGVYFANHLNGEGLDTGRIAATYSVSLDSGSSVKDLAGVAGSSSVGLGLGGLNVGYSEKGLDAVGIHIGLGVGVSANAEATSVLSGRHGRIGWTDAPEAVKVADKAVKKARKQD